MQVQLERFCGGAAQTSKRKIWPCLCSNTNTWQHWPGDHLCLSPVLSPILSSVYHLLYHPVYPPLLQTFVVAGGSFGEREYTSSVVSLLPGATVWIEKRSLPRALFVPRASVVGGKMWLVGGQTEDPDNSKGFRDEVTITSNKGRKKSLKAQGSV